MTNDGPGSARFLLVVLKARNVKIVEGLDNNRDSPRDVARQTENPPDSR